MVTIDFTIQDHNTYYNCQMKALMNFFESINEYFSQDHCKTMSYIMTNVNAAKLTDDGCEYYDIIMTS